MTDIEDAAVAALREAASALRRGEDAQDGKDRSDEPATPNVATEVGHVLDAIVRLLRAVDPDPAPTTQVGYNLQAVAQHLVAGATLARSVGRDTPSDPPTGLSESAVQADEK